MGNSEGYKRQRPCSWWKAETNCQRLQERPKAHLTETYHCAYCSQIIHKNLESSYHVDTGKCLFLAFDHSSDKRTFFKRIPAQEEHTNGCLVSVSPKIIMPVQVRTQVIFENMCVYVHVCTNTYMHAITTDTKTEARSRKESREGYMKRFGERKEKEKYCKKSQK